MRRSALEPIPVTALDDFRVGHWTDLAAGTGCTVVAAPSGATGAVDVRGGAPASRETDLLRPENTVEQVHAVCLSGGSAFGLEAASGVARALEQAGIGLPVGPTQVPIVCSSCIFDLAFGDAFTRPDARAGALAAQAALTGCANPDEHASADACAEGNVGAGTGATVGKLNGPACAMKGGLGARAFALCSLKVAAISAVNACGNVVDPVGGQPIAGMRPAPEAREIVSMEEAFLTPGGTGAMPLDRTNTTISCVFTNARLTKAQATKVAQIAADAYAHTIRPTHTTNDGDTIYVLASGTLDDADALPLDVVGLVATRALEAAITAGCTQAESLHGIPAARDLRSDAAN